MKKQMKNSKSMSVFKRLSLGAMICGYFAIALALAIVIISMIENSNANIPWGSIMISAAAAGVCAAGVLGIAQAVEGRYYGDVFGKMTRKAVTIMLTVFMSASVGFALLGYFSPALNIGEAGQYVQLVLYGLAALSFIGHTITSTLIVAKAK